MKKTLILSRTRLFCTILSLFMLYTVPAIGMDVVVQDSFESFTALLKNLRSDFSETTNVIPSSRIAEVKKAWYKLSLNHKFKSLEDEALINSHKKFTRSVQLETHPDKWSQTAADNQATIGELFKLFHSSDETDEKTFFHLVIGLEELRNSDTQNIDFSNTKIGELHLLCDKLKEQSHNYSTLFASEEMRTLLDQIRPLCDPNNWTTDNNKKNICDLSEKLSAPLLSLDPSSRMIRYLDQLKMIDENSVFIRQSEVATAKMLLLQASLYCQTSTLKGHDKILHDKIKLFCEETNWKLDINKSELSDLFNIFNSPNLIKQLANLQNKQQTFVSQLKSLRANDKVCPNEEIEKIKSMWNDLLKQSNVSCLENMDEEFQSQVRLQLFPDQWKAPHNRTNVVMIFENQLPNGLATTMFAPTHFIDLMKERLAHLQKSSMPLVLVEEIETICNHLKEFKPFYNYHKIDRLFYPFDPSSEQVLQALNIASDNDVNKYLTQPSEKEPFEISTIRQKITDLKANFSSNARPEKPYDSVIIKATDAISHNIFAPAAMFFMNKIMPGISYKSKIQDQMSFIVKQRLNNQKKDLEHKKIKLALKIKYFDYVFKK